MRTMHASKGTLWAIATTIALAGVACRHPAPQATTATTSPRASEASPATAGASTEERVAGKRERRGEAFVSVDGKTVGVLRASELPPTLAARRVKLADGATLVRYPVGAYLASLGVDVAKVRAVRFESGDRVSELAGREVRRLRDRLLIAFTQGERGKPRLVWPSERVDVTTTIDMVTGVAVFVDQDPPRVDPSADDARPAHANGTRVYVDGVYVSTFARRDVTSAPVAEGDDGEARYSLAAYLASRGAKGAPRAIDYVCGDDVVGRDTGDGAARASFAIPRHSHGKVKIELAGGSARPSAIEVYVRTAPPARAIVPSAALASNDAAPSREDGQGQGQQQEGDL
jgi:hypothetical protein